MDEYITISEAGRISGKHVATSYKGIRKGRIQSKQVEAGTNTIKKVLKEDIIRLFCIKVETQEKPVEAQVETQVETGRNLSKEDIKTTIEEVLGAKQSQLMKPIEDQALYRLGRIEQENTFLKEKVETLLQENLELQEKIKSLPDLQAEQKNMEELHMAELEALRLQAEEEQKVIVEAWQKKINELSRPWYRKLFS